MSLTFVGKNGRVYRRRFDHEEALRRKEAGETVASLSREYGVTENAVWQASSPGTKAANLRANAARRERGRCERCGGWKHGATKARLCKSCADDDMATSVRECELRCFSCGQWKPDEAFARSASTTLRRRGRHRQCSPCLTEARADYRKRNRERERAYDREYRRRRRAAIQAESEGSAKHTNGEGS